MTRTISPSTCNRISPRKEIDPCRFCEASLRASVAHSGLPKRISRVVRSSFLRWVMRLSIHVPPRRKKARSLTCCTALGSARSMDEVQ